MKSGLFGVNPDQTISGPISSKKSGSGPKSGKNRPNGSTGSKGIYDLDICEKFGTGVGIVFGLRSGWE